MEDRRILHGAPLPIARAYRRHLNAAAGRERHDAAYILFEVYLKYLSSISIATYLASNERDHRVNAALKGLAKPSLGEWLRFLRECLNHLASRPGERPALDSIVRLFKDSDTRWPHVVDLYNAMVAFRRKAPSQKEKVSLEALLAEIVAYRNAVVGHGAPLPAEHYGAFADRFGAAFCDLFDGSPWLLTWRLVSFDALSIRTGSTVECHVIEFMGDNPVRRQMTHAIPYGEPVPVEKALHLLDEGGGFLSLDPLVIARGEDVYLLNEAQGTPEYLSYSTGDHHRPSEMGAAEKELFERILGYSVDPVRLSRIGEDLARAEVPPAEGERRLGDYRILREIGRGAMGAVFEAIQESLGRRVALKILPGTFALDPRRIERFRREARATARIHFPNIVPVYEVGEVDGTHYYAMEYIEGPSLDALLARAREEARPAEARRNSSASDPAYIAHAVEQIAAVATGLEMAHRQGLIHRDVKPSNILVDADGRYVLVDFGLVHEVDAQTLTRSGEMVGTLNYMSPEQVSRGEVDARADVYSLGVTLYEILTLRPPFDGKSEHDLQRAILFEDPAPPRRFNPRLNRDLQTILFRAIEKNPERRYPSAAAFAADLKRFLRYEPIEARPLSALAKIGRRAWRHRVAVAAGAVMGVLALVAGILFLANREQERLRRSADYEPGIVREVMRMQRGILAMSAGRWDSTRIESEEILSSASQRAGWSGTRPSTFEPIEEAIDGLDALARIAPGRPDAYYHRAKGLELLGRDGEAIEYVERAIACDRAFVPAIILKAAILEQQGRAEEAGRERARARDLGRAGWTEIWLAAHQAQDEGRWGDAAQAYERLIDLELSEGPPYLGSSLEIRLGRGIACLEAKDHVGALAAFVATQALWPQAIEPALFLGKTHHLMGDEAKAEETFERIAAKALFPDEVALAAAAFYRSVRANDKALAWLERVNEVSVRERSKVLVLGRIGRFQEAIAAGRAAVAANPDDPRAHAQLAWALEKFGRVQEAIDVLRALPERFLDGDNTVCTQIGSLLEIQGDLDGARGMYEKALRINPADAHAHSGRASVDEKQGRTQEAIEGYRQALRLNPRQFQANIGIGNVMIRLGRERELLAFREDEIRRNPKDGFPYLQLALVRNAVRDYSGALAELDRAISLDPKDSWAFFTRGLALTWHGRIDEAIQAFRRSVDLFPTERYCNELGYLLMGRGRIAEARDVFQQGIAMNPTYEDNHVGYCSAMRALGRADEALRGYGDAARRDPDYPVAHVNLGCCLHVMEDYEAAAACFREAVRLDPTNTIGWYWLGVSCRNLRQFPEARRAFEHQIELNPLNGWPYDGLGGLHHALGDLDASVASWKKLLDMHPRWVDARAGLGYSLNAQGKTAEALREWCLAVWSYPRGYVAVHDNVRSVLRGNPAIEGAGPELERLIARLQEQAGEGPDNTAEVLKTLAVAWLHHPERRDPEKALAWARRAIEKRTRLDFEPFLILAEVLAAGGKMRDAILAIEDGMRLPNAPSELGPAVDEYRSKLLPDMPSYASIAAAVGWLGSETLIEKGSAWRFLRGKKEPSEDLAWTLPEFDDSAWEEGPSGFGYGDGDDATVLDDMVRAYTSVYLRRSFTVDDPASVKELILSVRIDDGFVAYLNGAEVARVRAGAAGERLAFDAVASESVTDAEATSTAISPAALRAGMNCLALQALNSSRGSSDMTVIPALTAIQRIPEGKARALLEGCAAAARGDDAKDRVDYLAGRLLQAAGKHREAAEVFAAIVERCASKPEPLLRLAECLRAAGDPAGAAARLAERLSGPLRDDRDLWMAWVKVNFVDLKRSPTELRAAIELLAPAEPTTAMAAGQEHQEHVDQDIAWLLAKLARGETIRINCGGPACRGPEGGWGADRFFEEGIAETIGAPEDSAGEGARTDRDPVDRDHRWFPSGTLRTPAYRIPLAPGTYEVTLHLIENWFLKPRQRSFDIAIEGTTALRGCDVAATAGYMKPERRVIEKVGVLDGCLDIEFIHRVQNPQIAGIEIRRTQ